MEKNQQQIYWIGGSPCAGKSAIAEILSEQFALNYYKVDDHFERHISQTNQDEHPACSLFKSQSSEEIWMAPPELQLKCEVDIYRELFDFVLEDILNTQKPILVEGAGCMPELIAPFVALGQSAVWIIPTEDFQRYHYGKRPWAKDVVKDCSDPKQAYDNWMARDAAFARYIQNEAKKFGFSCLLVGGEETIAENAKWAAINLGLEKER